MNTAPPAGTPDDIRDTASSPLAGLWAAVRFLTVLPVPGAAPTVAADLARGLVWFPVVGALIGLAAAAAERAGTLATGPLVGPVAAIAVGLLITGGLHLDGLADTTDGLAGGGSDRDRALAIMRDSRVGAMGAAAVCLSLLARFALLASISAGMRAPAVVAAAVGGRLAIVLAVGRFPYARREGGLGQPYAGRVSPAQLVVSGLLAAGLAVAAGLTWAAVRQTVIATAAAATAGLLLARRFSRRLGGLTGDTYGAVNECAEIVALFAAAAL